MRPANGRERGDVTNHPSGCLRAFLDSQNAITMSTPPATPATPDYPDARSMFRALLLEAFYGRGPLAGAVAKLAAEYGVKIERVEQEHDR